MFSSKWLDVSRCGRNDGGSIPPGGKIFLYRTVGEYAHASHYQTAHSTLPITRRHSRHKAPLLRIVSSSMGPSSSIWPGALPASHDVFAVRPTHHHNRKLAAHSLNRRRGWRWKWNEDGRPFRPGRYRKAVQAPSCATEAKAGSWAAACSRQQERRCRRRSGGGACVRASTSGRCGGRRRASPRA